MAFFGIGKKPGPIRQERQTVTEPPSEKCLTSRERLAQAVARVADLESRLEAAQQSVVELKSRFKIAQEDAIEAATHGKEPGSLAVLEAHLRSAQGRKQIFKEALERARISLRTAEAEADRELQLEQEQKKVAEQLEQDKKFILVLKELMGHAAKMAEWHERLGQLEAASDDRYPLQLLWPVFNEYAKCLPVADALINRFQPVKDATTNGYEIVLGEPSNDSYEETHKSMEMHTLKPRLSASAT